MQFPFPIQTTFYSRFIASLNFSLYLLLLGNNIISLKKLKKRNVVISFKHEEKVSNYINFPVGTNYCHEFYFHSALSIIIIKYLSNNKILKVYKKFWKKFILSTIISNSHNTIKSIIK